MYFPNKITPSVWENHPRWDVALSNGEFCHHSPEIPNSWQELKLYCNQHNLKIITLSIGFRDNVITFPANKEGYFLRQMSRYNFGSDTSSELFVVGYVEDGEVLIKKYFLPEMTLYESESRTIESCLESLI